MSVRLKIRVKSPRIVTNRHYSCHELKRAASALILRRSAPRSDGGPTFPPLYKKQKWSTAHSMLKSLSNCELRWVNFWLFRKESWSTVDCPFVMHVVQKRTVAWQSANGRWRLAGPRSFARAPVERGLAGAKTALDENAYLHSTTKHKLAKVSFFDSTQGSRCSSVPSSAAWDRTSCEVV